MNPIDKQIENIKKQNRLGLMTHVVLGYPNIEESRKIILTMVEAGADFIELQIPFSDPLGDGSVIRKANTKALANGFRVSQAFELVRQLRQEDKIQVPLLFMTYFNIVFNYGVEKFCKDSAGVGINGLIVPDYSSSAESRDGLEKYAKQNDLYFIKFLSLDSSDEHIKQVGRSAEGFVYCFAQRGVTGARQDMLAELANFLDMVRQQIPTPLAVGFGVSRAEHIRALPGVADVAIVGSAILESYNQQNLAGVKEKIQELIGAIR